MEGHAQRSPLPRPCRPLVDSASGPSFHQPDASSRRLLPRIGPPFALGRIAEAHDRVDAGPRERVLVSIPG
jgi:hypothetical protein